MSEFDERRRDEKDNTVRLPLKLWLLLGSILFAVLALLWIVADVQGPSLTLGMLTAPDQIQFEQEMEECERRTFDSFAPAIKAHPELKSYYSSRASSPYALEEASCWGQFAEKHDLPMSYSKYDFAPVQRYTRTLWQ